METVSVITQGSISGLQILDATKLLHKAHLLEKARLGPWHDVIFEDNRVRNANFGKMCIPVFRMPTYDHMCKVAENTMKRKDAFKKPPELPLGSVCWRSLLAKFIYVNEEDAVKDESLELKQFVEKTQVGCFGDTVACLVKVIDIYKIIFSNLEPRRWPQVQLNKAERVTTLIGDFSMLYFDNAKWFHFVPSHNGIMVGAYADQLSNLLKHGHTVHFNNVLPSVSTTGAMDTDSSTDPPLYGCWTINLFDNDEEKQAFTDNVRKEIEELGRRNVSSEIIINSFYGGVTTKSKEFLVSRKFANVIHNALFHIAADFCNVQTPEPGTRFAELLTENTLKKDKILESQLRVIEIAYFSASEVRTIREMLSAASDVMARMIWSISGTSSLDNSTLSRGLAFMKSVNVLKSNLAVLDWETKDLELLQQDAWLAGIADTIPGKSILSNEEGPTERLDNTARVKL